MEESSKEMSQKIETLNMKIKELEEEKKKLVEIYFEKEGTNPPEFPGLASYPQF